ncbi:hypothetical protein [Nocardia sp. R6R-6]|uniref:hypothetical protein n=1 Tax=Nocardia sp. R6R-6 TaxID=3459303 RepID=UPI00403E09E6
MVLGRRVGVLACVLSAGVWVAGCASAGPRLPDLPQSLSFTGNLVGTLDRGIDVHRHSSEATGWGRTMTRCSEYKPDRINKTVFAADIVGYVAGVKVSLHLGTYEDYPDGAYTHPGKPELLYVSEVNFLHIADDTDHDARYVMSGDRTGRSIERPFLTIDADHKGGTITASYGSDGHNPPASYPGVTTVTGHWQCG